MSARGKRNEHPLDHCAYCHAQKPAPAALPVPPMQQSRVQSYPAVRTLATAYRVIAYIVLIGGAIITFAIGAGTGSMLMAVVCGFAVALIFVVQLAAGELLGILPDIADSADETVQLLRKRTSSDEPKV